MGNLKNTIPKLIFFYIKNPPTLIRVIRKNKNPPKERERERERERESTHSFFLWEKYELSERNHIEFIQNKMGRRRVKI